MESETADDRRLNEHDEDEWSRFSSQMAFATGFWLGFLFAPSSYESRIMRERVRALVEARGQKMRVYLPKSPEQLRKALLWILDPQRDDASFVWIDGFFLETQQKIPWKLAWDEVFLRSNEHRELLRRRLHGGLVFAAPFEIKPRIREAAPDLWSIRALVLELEGGTYPPIPPDFFKLVASNVRFGLLLVEHTDAPDPDFWRNDALGSPELSAERAISLGRAADGFYEQSRYQEALDAASEFLLICKTLSSYDPIHFAMLMFDGLSLLSDTRGALGMHEEARQAARGAVEISRHLLKDQPLILATALDRLSLCESYFEEKDLALKLAEEAERVLAGSFGEQKPDIATLVLYGLVSFNLANRLISVLRVNEALESLQKALFVFGLIAKSNGSFFEFFVYHLGSFAELLHALQRYQEAFPIASEALDLLWPIYEKEPEKHRNEVAALFETLESLYQHLDAAPDEQFLASKARFAAPL